MRELPCGPVARTWCFHWVQSLIRELRSYKPCCTAKVEKKKQHKTNELAYILTERTTEDVCLKNNTSPNKQGKKEENNKGTKESKFKRKV